jgi:peptide/nickel transport system substrate-binding protein
MQDQTDRTTGPIDRRQFVQAAGGLTVAGMLAGCAGNGDGEGDGTTTTTGEGTDDGDQTTQDGGGGDQTLDVIWPGGINNINPFGWLTIPDYDAVRMVYEPLTSVDSEAKAIGHVAKDWEVQDDGALWTWEIQEGITWHDGEDLTAEDVAFMFKAIKQYEWPYLGSLSSVIAEPSEITVEGDYTVTTPLTQPYAALPLVLADLGLVVPAHIWSEFDDPTSVDNTQNPIGSGPFVFQERQQDQFLEYSVNGDYWGETPDYDRAVVNIIGSTDSQVLTMKNGDGDMLRLQPGQVVNNIQSAEGLEVVKAGSTYVNYLEPNTQRKPFSDVNFRRAVAYAVDRQTMAELVVGGYAEVGYSPIPPGLRFYHNADTTTYGHDKERARQMLDDNGYALEGGNRVHPDGSPMDIELSIPNTGNWPRMAEVLAQQLGEVGIKVTVNSMESNAHTDKVISNHDYQLSLNTWRVWFDPDPFLSPVFEEDGTLNTVQWHNEEFDRLMREQRRATDPQNRQQLLYDAQDILVDRVPWIVLFYPNLLHAMRSAAWTNFQPIPRYGMQSPYGLEPGTGPMVRLGPK